jgi:hypothetical protein
MGMESLTIDDLGFLKEMRKRLGIEQNDTSLDSEIMQMSPIDRVRLIAGWELGDPQWADTFKEYFESQGLYLTTNPEADGVIF